MLTVRAPGRANLIGEHTDYNEGFVLPVALELSVRLTGARNEDVLRLRSDAFPDAVEIDVHTAEGPDHGWGRYATAVVRALHDASIELSGFDGVVTSDLPPEVGLSSSAAFETAVALAVAKPTLEAKQLAVLCRRAETEYVGVQCGIMDQLASAGGRAGHALLIDCRTNEVEYVPVPDDLKIVLLDSTVRRSLASSPYNTRRAECNEAARAMDVPSLRDADQSQLEQHRDDMSLAAFKRARHIITDNRLVMEAADALRGGELDSLGRIFEASHRSYAEDFEASTEEIDILVRIAQETEGILASRLTGGGFGGCTVSIAHASKAEAAASEVLERYSAATGLSGRFWVSTPADGAALSAEPGFRA